MQVLKIPQKMTKISAIICLIIATVFCFSSNVSAKKTKGAYRSGEIWSKEVVRYGRFEVHMKPAKGSGLVSSFFLYKNDSHVPDVPWNEIDIEILGKDTTKVQTNLLSGPEFRRSYVGLHDNPVDLADDFHTYTLEWTPGEISFYINGELVRQEKERQVDDYWDQWMTYRFNFWPTHHTAWAGQFDDSILPAYHTIDWIKYYKYTPGEGPNGSKFTLSWVDSFNTFDENRWNKADWTFPENMAKFSPNNVVVQNGFLYLILQKLPELP